MAQRIIKQSHTNPTPIHPAPNRDRAKFHERLKRIFLQPAIA